jgi:subtilase family serine protease
MNTKFGIISLSIAVALAAAFQPAAVAQGGVHARTLVTRAVNENELVTRGGNVHPAVSWAQDLGKMSDSRALEHLRLQLKRSPEQEAELQAYLDELHNPKSANFHKWGTAAQFVQKFGPSQSDVSAVTEWLTSHGFKVNFITPAMSIDFSGTAGQVREAFHTEIHYLNANGERHFANVSNPKIPAALADAVLGPVALHDFKPHMLTSKVKPPIKNYTVNADQQLVVPGDMQKIYNYLPLYAAGISGQGQTVILLERTDLYNPGDFLTFRKVFGLTKSYAKGKLVTVHPQPTGSPVTAPNGVEFGPETCSDPGVVVGDDGEAAVDVEWASASAPNATIELASCADTDTNFGAFIALENLITAPTPPPPIMSLSYGSPESENGTDGNAYINALYQVAVFEGVSLFVSTGDADADVTDQNRPYATHGINVNALASTPNDVAVGGTDYGDTFLGENAVYWSPTNNTNTWASALSYIPEIPWNDSCASQLIAIALGYPTTYGAGGSCNSAVGEAYFLTTAGGSGGPSGCAYGDPTIPGVVSGTCTGYSKPSYQTLVYGNPSDGVRDLPDVSMFAANGVWGHYFVLCYSDPAGGGVPCPGNNPDAWAGAGGTSFGAPIWAGIQALINQATGSAQGDPDFFYYLLAGTEYGASGSATCNSTLGNATSPSCIFYDVTLGDNDANCRKLNGVAHNCFYPATNPGTNGVLSTSNTAYQPAYVTTTGYDFATGIGTPNVYNLVANFPGATIP